MSNRGGKGLDWPFLRLPVVLLAFIACVLSVFLGVMTRGAVSGFAALFSLFSAFIGWFLLTKETK